MFLGVVCSLPLMLQSAQHYPAQPVRVIEPFGVGGGPDLVARAVSRKLSELWGQPVTVENHPRRGKYGRTSPSGQVAPRRLYVTH
jgi:tripartite-type tricarboxylate transporter receptor subunit TctC